MKFKDIPLQIKEISDSGQFTGYAAAFNNVDLGGDIIMPGAFTKTISENADRPLLWHHDQAEPIGVTKAAEDTKGLVVEGRLNLDVQRAKEIHSLMKQGAVKGMSIGYEAITKGWKGGNRILNELKLHEISLTPIPMNPNAQVTSIKSVEDFEQLLKELVAYKGDNLSEDDQPLLEMAYKKLSALRAAKAPEAAMQDEIAPEILHAASSISKLLRGEL
jgi:HK97 family phage prohead protease